MYLCAYARAYARMCVHLLKCGIIDTKKKFCKKLRKNLEGKKHVPIFAAQTNNNNLTTLQLWQRRKQPAQIAQMQTKKRA